MQPNLRCILLLIVGIIKGGSMADGDPTTTTESTPDEDYIIWKLDGQWYVYSWKGFQDSNESCVSVDVKCTKDDNKCIGTFGRLSTEMSITIVPEENSNINITVEEKESVTYKTEIDYNFAVIYTGDYGVDLEKGLILTRNRETDPINFDDSIIPKWTKVNQTDCEENPNAASTLKQTTLHMIFSFQLLSLKFLM